METDAASRRHLLYIVGFLSCLFGGFALWGTVERAAASGSLGSLGIGAPVPVERERAAALAARRQWFNLRKQLSVYGKAREWPKAVSAAEIYLMHADDPTIRQLRAEALFRLSDARGGADLADSLRKDDSVSDAEADLMRGSAKAFLLDTRRALEKTDPSKVNALTANNAAWLAAFSPSITDPALLKKALELSEKSVQSARKEKSEELATYMNTLGGLYYRMGKYKAAIETLQESENLRQEPFNAAFLALTYRKLGDVKSAEVWEDRLEKYLSETFATRDGQNYRHQLLLLWREIETGTKE